jgi:hypothetical protein
MLLLPTERYAKLVIDSNAVPPGLIAFQTFQSIPRGDRQIFQTHCDIDRLELSLRAPPELPRDSSGVSRIAFAEKVSGRFIGERLNHVRRRYYMASV